MNEHYEYVMNDLTAKLFDKNKKRKISVEKYIQSMLALFAASPASAFNQAKKNIKQVINADIKKHVNEYKQEKQGILDELLAEVENYETDYKKEHADEFELKTDKKEEVEQVESESEIQDKVYTDETQNNETSTALNSNSW